MKSNLFENAFETETNIDMLANPNYLFSSVQVVQDIWVSRSYLEQ